MDGKPDPDVWTHVVVNYIGPDNGQGIQIYYDGQIRDSNEAKQTSMFETGNGFIAVGKRLHDKQEGYASLEIDELALFNTTLSDDVIMQLFDLGK